VSGIALDISPRALTVAATNAQRHAVDTRLKLIESDGFEALDPLTDIFQLIVSNPPYVVEETFETLQREVREHEPRGALTPGGDGLAMIRRLLTESSDFLVPGGHLLIEIGFDQHEAVTEMIDPQTWTLIEIRKDLQGIHRTVVLQK
jgi:release factor glutamine methyltransferase